MRTRSKLKRHPKAPTSAAVVNYRAARAAMLDRLADAELAHGRTVAAELPGAPGSRNAGSSAVTGGEARHER